MSTFSLNGSERGATPPEAAYRAAVFAGRPREEHTLLRSGRLDWLRHITIRRPIDIAFPQPWRRGAHKEIPTAEAHPRSMAIARRIIAEGGGSKRMRTE